MSETSVIPGSTRPKPSSRSWSIARTPVKKSLSPKTASPGRAWCRSLPRVRASPGSSGDCVSIQPVLFLSGTYPDGGPITTVPSCVHASLTTSARCTHFSRPAEDALHIAVASAKGDTRDDHSLQIGKSAQNRASRVGTVPPPPATLAAPSPGLLTRGRVCCGAPGPAAHHRIAPKGVANMSRASSRGAPTGPESDVSVARCGPIADRRSPARTSAWHRRGD